MARHQYFSVSRILFFSLIVLSPIQFSAQSLEGSFKALPAYSIMSVQDALGNDISGTSGVGLGVSSSMAYFFNYHIGVQAEVLYSASQFKFAEGAIDRKLLVKNFNIPLLFSWNSCKFQRWNCNLVAGPQIGFSARTEISDSDGTVDNTLLVNSKESNVGLAYGGGVDYALRESGAVFLTAGIRGITSFKKFNNSSIGRDQISYGISDQHNIQIFALYLGLNFRM